MRIVLAVLFTSFLSACVTRSTVTEEDRQGVDVERQILEAQDAELDRLDAAVKEDPKSMSAMVPVVARMREKNSDARAVNGALEKNWGPPEKPVMYAHAEVPGLISRIIKSHQIGFWGAVGGAFLTGALALIGLARSPLARMIPGIGTIFASLDSTIGAIETWMKKMKEGGRPEVAEGLANVLQAAHEDAKVSPYVAKALAKIKVADEIPEEVIDAAHAAAHANISPPEVPAAPSSQPASTAAST